MCATVAEPCEEEAFWISHKSNHSNQPNSVIKLYSVQYSWTFCTSAEDDKQQRSETLAYLHEECNEHACHIVCVFLSALK